MFEAFAFSVLDNPDFKEDSVREELLAPILKRLGYQASGEIRVQRSKSLAHPFVRIGTRKQAIKIIPDYTLWYGDTAVLVLDAKRPTETLDRSEHLEQAYSYAIHPDVRASHYALCNGRNLMVYDVREWDPILDLALADTDSRWADVERVLLPKHLKHPIYRNLLPDLGLVAYKLGVPAGEVFTMGCRFKTLARVTDEIYTGQGSYILEEREHLASFDFPRDALTPMLSCLAEPLKEQVLGALSRSPYHANVDCMLEVELAVCLGAPTQGEHDKFVPFLVVGIVSTKLNREELPIDTFMPEYIFSLRKAFHEINRRH